MSTNFRRTHTVRLLVSTRLAPLLMTMARRQPRPRRGRRPLGLNGEKVSGYPQVMLRLPRLTKSTLDALRALTGTPIWRLIDQAVAAYVRQLPQRERTLLSRVRGHRAVASARKRRRP